MVVEHAGSSERRGEFTDITAIGDKIESLEVVHGSPEQKAGGSNPLGRTNLPEPHRHVNRIIIV
jgi:hypothetical protein